MKKTVLVLVLGILLIGVNAFAGEGDFIVKGKLGIGTTAPAVKTHIYGDQPAFRIQDDGGSFGQIQVLNNAEVWAGAYSGDLVLVSGGGEKARITSGGNVGIGTTNPASRLDLGGGCMTGTICSDGRLKKNIAALPGNGDYLAKILQISGVSFEWKNLDEGKRYFGLVAQEVEKVLPEVVSTSNSEDAQKGLSCTGLSAVIIEAIKEQQKVIEELKAKVKHLEAKDLVAKSQ